MRRTVRMQPWLSLSLIMLAVFALSMGMASWALYERFTQTNQRREYQSDINRQMAFFRAQQQVLNARVAQVSLDYCEEIENLKREQRERAELAYRNRVRDFRLLGLRLTPAIERRLKENLKAQRERYAAVPCPRPRKP